SSADIRDFMVGSARRRLRLVLIQLHDLLDRSPKVYELLERKRILESSPVTLTRVDRALNSLWGELKARCSLLILDKDVSHGVVRESPLVDGDDCPDKVEFVQSLVFSVVSDVIANCTLLWELLKTSVRGLVLVYAGADLIGRMWRLPGDSNGDPELQQTAVRVLLESCAVVPDLYKAVIKDVVEAVAATGTLRATTLVVSELQRHRVLPGVLFRTLSRSLKASTLTIEEARLRLDDLFSAGAASWIRPSLNGSRPKYAQAGAELKDALLEQFDRMAEGARQQHVLSFVRAVAGLIGYLRLDVGDSDFVFFSQAATAAAAPEDRRSVDACTALFLVLFAFEDSQLTSQQILGMAVDISQTPTAHQLDCVLAHLVAEQVKDVNDFVLQALAMDFSYPRERLYALKDALAQTTVPYFVRANICRRLVCLQRPSIEATGRGGSDASTRMPTPTPLHREAVLHLLQSNAFQSSGVDVREWITCLVRSADTSTAAECGRLVKAYVVGVFASSAITPIPETLLWTEFAAWKIDDPTGCSAPSSQILLLLYILYYCEQLLEQPKRLTMGFSFIQRRPTITTPSTGSTSTAAAAAAASAAAASSMTSSAPSTAASLTGSAVPSQFGLSGRGMPISRTGSLSSPISSGRNGSPVTQTFGAVKRGEYSDQLLDSLPVSWILQCVSHSPDYRQLWPELLAMATAQHPDQLDIMSVMRRELASGSSSMAAAAHALSNNTTRPTWVQESPSSRNGVTAARADFDRHLCTANGLLKFIGVDDADFVLDMQSLRYVMQEYAVLPMSVRMETCGQFAAQLCRAALPLYQDQELAAGVRQAWLLLHTLNPRVVSTATVNAWRSAAEMTKPRLITQDIWLDPLVVLRSDARVFQSASMVDVLLTILGEFLILSRAAMRRIYTLRQKESGALKKSHLTAMVQLQESGALQMLIEAVRFVGDEEARWLVYEFVHARFLEQRTIQKLVHFQAYDIAAIRDMVDYVPSMHACSEFIPELLMQSAPRLQLFSINLAASIASKYPIMANEGMAKEVILPHIQTTLVQIAGTVVSDQLTISNAMLSAVVTIGASFSAIRDDCKRLVSAVKDSAVERVSGMLKSPQTSNAQQPQQQSLAKWIACCEQVLKTIDALKKSAADDKQPAYVSIEDTEAGDVLAKLEKASQAEKKGNANSKARAGSPGPPDALGTQHPPASGMQLPPGVLRPPPVPPLAHLQKSHQTLQQQQQQFNSAPTPGALKRPHNSISAGGGTDRSGIATGGGGGAGGQQVMDAGRNRSGSINGSGTPHHLGSQAHSTMHEPLSPGGGSGQPMFMNTGHPGGGGGSGGLSPGKGPPMGQSGNFKRRNRHRARPAGGRKDGMIGGGNGLGSNAGPVKRGKSPGGGDWPRAMDR
ncbi:hypothetical protein GGI07_005799, partial [Coemansia sp. Benny D115]